MADGTGQPDDWSRVLILTPPRATAQNPAGCGDLCNGCAADLVRWLIGQDEREEAGAT